MAGLKSVRGRLDLMLSCQRLTRVLGPSGGGGPC